ncbi:hypothetical protein SAMN05216251_12776 [Actinacidiphila alni]|uniref:Uncharacterized protein n=1 Tax=Actinacidiphila alni TaxID=380248 RepID=A0A1I2L9A7_9ACTN|nr:hypothetical protein [Actinacidiphila alni]SFF75563.1 hypothetical protein SAMN05216251_12776 [Actinacidiphila alni]
MLTTDSGSVRVSHGPDADAVPLQDAPAGGETTVLLGASPAFGFGATSGRTTIPSQLSHGARGSVRHEQ